MKTDTVSVFDLDDCIAITSSRIRFKISEDVWHAVSTNVFAIIRDSLPKHTLFDFDDFRGYENTFSTIMSSKLININLIKDAFEKNHSIGIITARGGQKAVFDALSIRLAEQGIFLKDKFKPKFIFALNDEKTSKHIKEEMKNSSYSKYEDMKSFVMGKYFLGHYGFKKAVFYDDDIKNILAMSKIHDVECIKV